MPHPPLFRQPIHGTLPLLNDVDVVACRRTVRDVTTALKFSATSQTMFVTAASELARNVLVHGGGGRFSWSVLGNDANRGLRLSFEDEGPGIADIGRAMTNGWTSKKGLGLGLPGAKRLVDEFDLQSAPGLGTRVVITRWGVTPVSRRLP